jgi:hypothetical protein
VRIRPLARHDVTIGVPLHEADVRQRRQPLQDTDGVVANRDEIAQHPVAVNPTPGLDVGEDRVDGDRVAMRIRQERETHPGSSRPNEQS